MIVIRVVKKTQQNETTQQKNPTTTKQPKPKKLNKSREN